MTLNASVFGNGGGSGVGTGNPIFYAKRYGVTGINDGSRDDAPLIRTAYTEAVAAGASALVLPVGDVWMNSFDPATYNGSANSVGYPWANMLRVEQSNFTIVVPEGCTVHTNEAESNTTNSWSIFTFYAAGTIRNSGICGGGRFVHENSSYASQKKLMFAHLGSLSDNCFIRNLSGENSYPQSVGAFDNSSSFVGFLENLYVKKCYSGIVQSSTAATTGGTMIGLTVKDYIKYGISSFGENMNCANWTTDNRETATAEGLVSDNAAVRFDIRASGTTLNGLNAIGKDKTVGALSRVFWIRGTNSATTSGLRLANIRAETFYDFAKVSGMHKDIVFDGVDFCDAVNFFDNATGTLTNKNVGFYNVNAAITGIAFKNTAGAGFFDLDNVTVTGHSSFFDATCASRIRKYKDSVPVTIARPTTANGLAATDKGVQFYDNALASPRPVYYSGGAAVWYDGAGAAV